MHSSLLAVALSRNGRMHGAVTCSFEFEHAAWSARQVSILTKVGSSAMLALSNTRGSYWQV
jgi:hypothetical protein